ncbi:MAG: RNA polymerase sigma-70 factor (ECF subfamily) [Alphaproteobacteria bacterium]|jgi:RNA polymerase sigma-70 factor (ECF subfamily)
MDTHLKLVDPHSRQDTTESQLIAMTQAQDKEAFRALYQMHLSKVYGLCCRLCCDRSQAEDATQEVFIQVWQKIGNFKGDSKFSTWLHSVAANVTISYVRKQKGWWQKMMNIEESNVQEPVSEASIADTDIEKWILRLPERARWVFVLHAIEGYRHDQVADMLGIAVGTSKAQFHRAKHLIEEWMDE